MATPKNIVLKGDPIRKEAAAGTSGIKPGMLLEWDGNGDLQPHDDAGQNAAPMFAVEEDFLGSDIESEYADEDRVQYVMTRQGDEIYAWLDSGENVDKGAFLESAGNGHLKEHTPQEVNEDGTSNYSIYTRAIVAQAMEDVDAGTSTKRIRVEVV